MEYIGVSISQMRTFRKCARQWKLSREYDNNETRSKALITGDVTHQALELFHGGESREVVRARISELTKATGFAFLLDDGTTGEDVFSDASLEPWCLGWFEAYMDYERIRQDGDIGVIEEPERGFPEEDADGNLTERGLLEREKLVFGEVRREDGSVVKVYLKGRWDGCSPSVRTIFEHKTVGTLTAVTDNDLRIDEQVSAMMWAASRLHGTNINKCVYNLLGKPSVKMNPRGKPETTAKYARRVYDRCAGAYGTWFTRIFVERTETELDFWARDAIMVAEAMVKGPWWPALSASWSGPCRFCKFREACEVWHNEGARKEILDARFQKREK